MSGALITKMTLYGYPDVLCVTCMQSQRKESQVTSEQGTSRQGFINGSLFPLPLNLGCRRKRSRTPLSSGDRCHPPSAAAWDPLPQIYCLYHKNIVSVAKLLFQPLDFRGSWKAAGGCSRATECLNSSNKGKFSSAALERVSLAHLRMGARAGGRKQSFYI